MGPRPRNDMNLLSAPQKRFKASSAIPKQFEEFDPLVFWALFSELRVDDESNVPVEVDPKFFWHKEDDDDSS